MVLRYLFRACRKRGCTKNNVVTASILKGTLKQKKQIVRHQAMPELGLIPQIDFNPTGIG